MTSVQTRQDKVPVQHGDWHTSYQLNDKITHVCRCPECEPTLRDSLLEEWDAELRSKEVNQLEADTKRQLVADYKTKYPAIRSAAWPPFEGCWPAYATSIGRFQGISHLPATTSQGARYRSKTQLLHTGYHDKSQAYQVLQSRRGLSLLEKSG